MISQNELEAVPELMISFHHQKQGLIKILDIDWVWQCVWFQNCGAQKQCYMLLSHLFLNIHANVHILWEGHKILWNLHHVFCGLLRIYEQIWIIGCGNSIEQNKTKQFLVWSIGMIDIHSFAYIVLFFELMQMKGTTT